MSDRIDGPRARTVDTFDLYQRIVQSPDSSTTLVDELYWRLRRRRAKFLREDFCGTAAVACEWVRRRAGNTALGLDIDRKALAWGAAHNAAALDPRARKRLRLVCCDVKRSGPRHGRPDLVLAMNYSWAALVSRRDLLCYFRAVRRALAPGGLLVLEIFGGYDMARPLRERSVRSGVTYVWEHLRSDAVASTVDYAIHFGFRDGSWRRGAFTYRYRVWSTAETRELLGDAGFTDSAVLLRDPGASAEVTYSAVTHGAERASWSGIIVASR